MLKKNCRNKLALYVESVALKVPFGYVTNGDDITLRLLNNNNFGSMRIEFVQCVCMCANAKRLCLRITPKKYALTNEPMNSFIFVSSCACLSIEYKRARCFG